MLVIPAIDLKDGEAVRLYKGDYSKKTIYSKNPEELALDFERQGAKFIHIVDLDGAKDGECINLNTIKKIRENISIPMEIGGGIRNEKTVELYLNTIGVDRVILGTSAVEDPEFLNKMLDKYGNEKIVVGVDVKNGFVSINGWLENSKIEYIEFIKKLEQIGVKYIIVTDISKDGTLEGPNFLMYKKIKEQCNINIIISGGIKDSSNIYKAKEEGYYGCIVGKAYYEGKIDLSEVIYKCLKKE